MDLTVLIVVSKTFLYKIIFKYIENIFLMFGYLYICITLAKDNVEDEESSEEEDTDTENGNYM